MNKTFVPNQTQIAKEMKDKRDLSHLVDYYRQRIENIEAERVEFLKRLEGIRISQEEFHKMEWELKKRNEEVAELQDAVKKSTLGIHEERKQIFHLTSELEMSKRIN